MQGDAALLYLVKGADEYLSVGNDAQRIGDEVIRNLLCGNAQDFCIYLPAGLSVKFLENPVVQVGFRHCEPSLRHDARALSLEHIVSPNGF